MTAPVFISYARTASREHAQALAARLGDRAFFDTQDIADGDPFPQRLVDGILDSNVVVIFATQPYAESLYCTMELRLALASGCELILALGDGAQAVLDSLPPSIARRSWPRAVETEKLDRLAFSADSSQRPRLSPDDRRSLTDAFLEESDVLPALPLGEMVHALPPGVAGQSIGARFVGRADDLRRK